MFTVTSSACRSSFKAFNLVAVIACMEGKETSLKSYDMPWETARTESSLEANMQIYFYGALESKIIWS